MVGPKSLDLPPCLDLQLVFVICRDLEEKLDGCGTIGVDGNTFFDTVALDSGGHIGCPLKSSQILANGTLSGWKNVLVGPSKANVPTEDPKISHGQDGPVISLPNFLVDNVTSGLKLCFVSRFVEFTPIIEMVCKWVSQKWKVRESVGVSTMPSSLFCFKFTSEEYINLILFGTLSCLNKMAPGL